MAAQNVIDLLKNRDENGAEELLRHFGPLLRYVIAPFLSDPRDREEVLQDCVLKVWQEIDRFDPEKGSWTSWLNRARSEKRLETGELSEDEADSASTPEEETLRGERQEALLRALNTLSRRDRILFCSKYYYCQPTAQIAAELGMSERAVEGRLYRIRQKLKDLLKGEMS